MMCLVGKSKGPIIFYFISNYISFFKSKKFIKAILVILHCPKPYFLTVSNIKDYWCVMFCQKGPFIKKKS